MSVAVRCRGWVLALCAWVLASAASAGPVALDTGFGVGGRALSNFRGNNDDPVSPVRDASGRYLFMSIGDHAGGSQVNVVRVLANGALDTSFGDGGIASVFPANNQLYAGGMTLDGSGRILVSYATYGEFCNTVGVTRLTANGALDTGFGTGGSVFVDPSGLEFGGCGLVSNAGGIAWNGETGTGYRLALATTSSNATGLALHGTVTQLFENGDPDIAFAGNGVRQLAVGSGSTFRGLAYAGNRIYVWGSRTAGASTDVLVARIQSFDGALDTLFGSSGAQGYMVTDFGEDSVANAFVEAGCPTIGGSCFFLAGSVKVGGVKQALLARYIAQFSACNTDRATPAPCLHNGAGAFDGDGWLALDLDGGSDDDEAWVVTLQDPTGLPQDQTATLAGIASPAAAFGVGPAFTARLNAAGFLDAGYGSGGVQLNVLGTPVGPRVHATADDDGAAFVLGRGTFGLGKEATLGKRLANGSADAGFGVAGLTRIRAANAQSSGNDLALDAQSRPLLVGTVRNSALGRFEIGLARFTAAGARDTSFVGFGAVTHARDGDSFGEGNGVALQPADGKIVVVGTTNDGVDTRLTVLRLQGNGLVDTGFADQGWFRLTGVDVGNSGRDVLVEAGGRIVAAGAVSSGGDGDALIVALDATGALDSSFGPGGAGFTRLALAGNQTAVEVHPYPGGGYAIVGTSVVTGFDAHVLLARLDANGIPLLTVVDSALPGSVDARALAVDADGRFYVGGGRVSAPLLARFDATGTLDTGWGVNGEAVLAALPGWIESVQLDGGKPLAGGIGSVNGGIEHVAYRTLADGSAPDTDFNGNGRVTVAHAPGGLGGMHWLDAGGNLYLGGTGSAQFAVAKLATRAASSVTLSAAPANASQYAQQILFTATASGGAGTPTGTVEIHSGANLVGSGTLSGGVASITVSSLEVDSYAFTARYLGDAVYAPSESAPALAYTVGKAATTATLVNLDPDASSASGEDVSFTFGASGNFGTVPTGSVRFYVDNVASGDYTLSSGTTTITTDDLPPGAHTLHIVYLGDQRHLASDPSTSVPHTVGLAATGTSLMVTPSASAVGQTVTLDAMVGGLSGLPPVTGSVEFRDGATVLATVALNASQQASFSTSALSAGDHSLTAVYLGDSNYSGSTSPIVVHSVGKLVADMAFQATPVPSLVGESVTLQSTMSGSGGTPTGTIEFRYGSTSLGTVPLVNGVASVSTTVLPYGLQGLSAVYSGDATYGGYTFGPVPHAVEKRTSTTTLEAMPGPTSNITQPVTLRATVTSQPGFPVTGSVEFRDGGVLMGTVPLVDGEAVLATTSLIAGSHSFVASWAGDGNYHGSTSADVPHQVVVPPDLVFANGFE